MPSLTAFVVKLPLPPKLIVVPFTVSELFVKLLLGIFASEIIPVALSYCAPVEVLALISVLTDASLGPVYVRTPVALS